MFEKSDGRHFKESVWWTDLTVINVYADTNFFFDLRNYLRYKIVEHLKHSRLASSDVRFNLICDESFLFCLTTSNDILSD